MPIISYRPDPAFDAMCTAEYAQDTASAEERPDEEYTPAELEAFRIAEEECEQEQEESEYQRRRRWELEDEAVERAEQRMIDRWNDDDMSGH